MFHDRARLTAVAGRGGDGSIHFRREKYVPRGGPDGGDGGHGGDVIVRAVAGADNLAEVVHRKHWRAQNGAGGQGSNCTGRRGRNLVITVPPGTLVLDRDRGNVLRDLTAAYQYVMVAL